MGGSTPGITAANVAWIWSALNLKMNMIGSNKELETSNISGHLDACVTLTAVTALISSPRRSMDGSGLLIKLGSIPQMELLSKTGPSLEDSTHPVVNPITVKQLNKEEKMKPAWPF